MVLRTFIDTVGIEDSDLPALLERGKEDPLLSYMLLVGEKVYGLGLDETMLTTLFQQLPDEPLEACKNMAFKILEHPRRSEPYLFYLLKNKQWILNSLAADDRINKTAFSMTFKGALLGTRGAETLAEKVVKQLDYATFPEEVIDAALNNPDLSSRVLNLIIFDRVTPEKQHRLQAVINHPKFNSHALLILLSNYNAHQSVDTLLPFIPDSLITPDTISHIAKYTLTTEKGFLWVIERNQEGFILADLIKNYRGALTWDTVSRVIPLVEWEENQLHHFTRRIGMNYSEASAEMILKIASNTRPDELNPLIIEQGDIRLISLEYLQSIRPRISQIPGLQKLARHPDIIANPEELSQIASMVKPADFLHIFSFREHKSHLPPHVVNSLLTKQDLDQEEIRAFIDNTDNEIHFGICAQFSNLNETNALELVKKSSEGDLANILLNRFQFSTNTLMELLARPEIDRDALALIIKQTNFSDRLAPTLFRHRNFNERLLEGLVSEAASLQLLRLIADSAYFGKMEASVLSKFFTLPNLSADHFNTIVAMDNLSDSTRKAILESCQSNRDRQAQVLLYIKNFAGQASSNLLSSLIENRPKDIPFERSTLQHINAVSDTLSIKAVQRILADPGLSDGQINTILRTRRAYELEELFDTLIELKRSSALEPELLQQLLPFTVHSSDRRLAILSIPNLPSRLYEQIAPSATSAEEAKALLARANEESNPSALVALIKANTNLSAIHIQADDIVQFGKERLSSVLAEIPQNAPLILSLLSRGRGAAVMSELLQEESDAAKALKAYVLNSLDAPNLPEKYVNNLIHALMSLDPDWMMAIVNYPDLTSDSLCLVLQRASHSEVLRQAMAIALKKPREPSFWEKVLNNPALDAEMLHQITTNCPAILNSLPLYIHPALDSGIIGSLLTDNTLSSTGLGYLVDTIIRKRLVENLAAAIRHPNITDADLKRLLSVTPLTKDSYRAFIEHHSNKTMLFLQLLEAPNAAECLNDLQREVPALKPALGQLLMDGITQGGINPSQFKTISCIEQLPDPIAIGLMSMAGQSRMEIWELVTAQNLRSTLIDEYIRLGYFAHLGIDELHQIILHRPLSAKTCQALYHHPLRDNQCLIEVARYNENPELFEDMTSRSIDDALIDTLIHHFAITPRALLNIFVNQELGERQSADISGQLVKAELNVLQELLNHPLARKNLQTALNASGDAHNKALAVCQACMDKMDTNSDLETLFALLYLSGLPDKMVKQVERGLLASNDIDASLRLAKLSQRPDTLLKIVERVKPDSTSVFEALWSAVLNNPHCSQECIERLLKEKSPLKPSLLTRCIFSPAYQPRVNNAALIERARESGCDAQIVTTLLQNDAITLSELRKAYQDTVMPMVIFRQLPLTIYQGASEEEVLWLITQIPDLFCSVNSIPINIVKNLYKPETMGRVLKSMIDNAANPAEIETMVQSLKEDIFRQSVLEPLMQRAANDEKVLQWCLQSSIILSAIIKALPLTSDRPLPLDTLCRRNDLPEALQKSLLKRTTLSRKNRDNILAFTQSAEVLTSVLNECESLDDINSILNNPVCHSDHLKQLLESDTKLYFSWLESIALHKAYRTDCNSLLLKKAKEVNSEAAVTSLLIKHGLLTIADLKTNGLSVGKNLHLMVAGESLQSSTDDELVWFFAHFADPELTARDWEISVIERLSSIKALDRTTSTILNNSLERHQHQDMFWQTLPYSLQKRIIEDPDSSELHLMRLLDCANDKQVVTDCVRMTHTWSSSTKLWGRLLENPLLEIEHKRQLLRDASSLQLSYLINECPDHPISNDDLQNILQNPDCTIQHLKSLYHSNRTFDAKLKRHMHCWLKKEELEQQIDTLKPFITDLQSKKNAQTEFHAVHELYKALHAKKDQLYQPGRIINADDLDRFKTECQAEITRYSADLKKDKPLWNTLKSILHGIVAILAIITIVPALIIIASSKSGERLSFFKTSPKNNLPTIDSMQQQIQKMGQSENPI